MTKILDCTIRDGGFVNNWEFSHEYILKLLKNCSDSGLYCFEAGYISNKDNVNIGRNVPLDYIKNIKKNNNINCKISVMIDTWTYDFSKLPHKNQTQFDIIRLCTYLKDLNNIKEIIQIVKSLDYEVSINIMCCSKIVLNEYQIVKNFMRENFNFIDYCYFADSLGSMTPSKTRTLFKEFTELANKTNICLGFHAHNKETSLANVLEAIDNGAGIVDATLRGMGRGCGNLKLEIIVLYLYYHYNDININIKSFLYFLTITFEKEELLNFRHNMNSFLKVHPYRINDLDPYVSNLGSIHDYYESLSEEKKIDYKL